MRLRGIVSARSQQYCVVSLSFVGRLCLDCCEPIVVDATIAKAQKMRLSVLRQCLTPRSMTAALVKASNR